MTGIALIKLQQLIPSLWIEKGEGMSINNL